MMTKFERTPRTCFEALSLSVGEYVGVVAAAGQLVLFLTLI